MRRLRLCCAQVTDPCGGTLEQAQREVELARVRLCVGQVVVADSEDGHVRCLAVGFILRGTV